MVLLLALMGCQGLRPLPGRSEEGMASYYSDALSGRKTASGQPYDPGKATCAHRTHPFGTWLKVTVQDTGKSAHCRVNDRGPFVSGRVVDVSRLVAVKLDLLRRGVVPVELRVVDPPAWAAADALDGEGVRSITAQWSVPPTCQPVPVLQGPTLTSTHLPRRHRAWGISQQSRNWGCGRVF